MKQQKELGFRSQAHFTSDHRLQHTYGRTMGKSCSNPEPQFSLLLNRDRKFLVLIQCLLLNGNHCHCHY